MHAAEGENGELWARVGDGCLSAFRRLENLRICYFVALRDRGAVYYAAASEGARHLAALPMMRPIAIDPFNADETSYLEASIRVLSARSDFASIRASRASMLRTFRSYAAPFTTAHAGDSLTGDGPLESATHAGRPGGS